MEFTTEDIKRVAELLIAIGGIAAAGIKFVVQPVVGELKISMAAGFASLEAVNNEQTNELASLQANIEKVESRVVCGFADAAKAREDGFAAASAARAELREIVGLKVTEVHNRVNKVEGDVKRIDGVIEGQRHERLSLRRAFSRRDLELRDDA